MLDRKPVVGSTALRQTSGYQPSRKASSSFGQKQFGGGETLLNVNNLAMKWSGVDPTTFQLHV